MDFCSLSKNLQFMPNPHKTWWEWSTNEVIIFTKFHKNWAKSVDFLIQWAKIKSAAFIWEIGFRTIPKWYYLLQPRNITKVQFRNTAFIRRIKDSLKKYWLLFEKRNLFGFPAHNRAKLYVMAKVIITVVLKTALFVQRNIEMKFPFPPPEQMAILD